MPPVTGLRLHFVTEHRDAEMIVLRLPSIMTSGKKRQVNTIGSMQCGRSAVMCVDAAYGVYKATDVGVRWVAVPLAGQGGSGLLWFGM